MYKLILADLDFTLLDDNRNVSRETLEAVKKIQKAGVEFGICSGRSFMSLKRFTEMFNINKIGNLCICYNGSVIYEPYDNNIISQIKIKMDYAIEILSFLRNYDVDIIIYDTDKVMAEKLTPRVEEYMRISVLEPIIFNKFEDYIKGDITKILIKGNNEDLKKIEEEFLKNELSKKVLSFFSSKDLFEFNPLGVDKGNGVIKLSEYTGIPLSDIITIGDNYNDISMIEKAGLGVAVANANDDVKKIADYVTKATNNQCVMEEIYEMFIKK